jgi:hypothetical protein
VRRLAPIVALWVAGCGAPADAPRRPGPDKARLFGDAGLVPTREGERIRRELALAGELRAVLRGLSGIADAYVDVETEPAPGRALIRVDLRADAPAPAAVEDQVRLAAAAVLPGAQATVLAGPAPAAPGGAAPPVLLGIALLGLGLSAGVALERVRAQRRRLGRP